MCNAPATFKTLTESAFFVVFACCINVTSSIVEALTRRAILPYLGVHLWYPGHVILGNCILVDPQKIDAVLKWPLPKHKKDLRRFLALYSYYRIFVFSFADVAKPLQRLIRKKFHTCDQKNARRQ